MESVILSSPSCILCCRCGQKIEANLLATCTSCLEERIDITEIIEKSLTVSHCKHCERYQRPPWMACTWESNELLALCLKKIKALQKKNGLRLVDAQFLYTEPHSRRIRIKLVVQQECQLGVIVEQDCVVEFKIIPTQCDDCKQAFTPHIWHAVVQVRQRVAHKRSLLYLEQLILRYNLHEKVLRILEAPDGIDFQFSSRSRAQRFAQFVNAALPVKIKYASQMISHDPKSNTAFFKHTYAVDVCTICRDDLVYLPRNIASQVYGGSSQFLLCLKITTDIYLIDPFTAKSLAIASEKYWKFPFNSILNKRHLTEFIVLNVEKVQNYKNPSQKISLHEVELAAVKDLGVNDRRHIVLTHLNHIYPGDTLLGYDLTTLNIAGDKIDISTEMQYNVILVKKKRIRSRQNKYKKLEMERPKNIKNQEEMDVDELEEDLEDKFPELSENYVSDEKFEKLHQTLKEFVIDDGELAN